MASTWNNGSLDCHNTARSSTEQPSQPRAKCGICWIAVKKEINSAARDSPLSGPARRQPAGSRSHIPGRALQCCLGILISEKSCSQASQSCKLVASCVHPQTENLGRGKKEKSLTELPSGVCCRELTPSTPPSFSHVPIFAALQCSITLSPGPGPTS